MKVPELYTKIDKRIINVLNSFVLISALVVIIDLSYNILTTGFYDPQHGLTLEIQLWVCVIFLFDYVVRLIIAPHKLRFVGRNLLLLLFSIPYLNIIHYSGLVLNQEFHYLLSLIPLLRAGFGLGIIIHWYTRRTSTSLLFSYLSVLFAMIYFGTLLFYVMEQEVNPNVHTFWDALWWAMMNVTTVGSNIVAITTIGKILSVLLSALGIMVLPVFTVYISDRMQVLNNASDHSSPT